MSHHSLHCKKKKKKKNSNVFSLCPLPVHKLSLIASDPIFRWISVSFNILSNHSPRKTVRPILPETVSSRTKESHSPLSEGQWMGRDPQMPLVRIYRAML